MLAPRTGHCIVSAHTVVRRWRFASRNIWQTKFRSQSPGFLLKKARNLNGKARNKGQSKARKLETKTIFSIIDCRANSDGLNPARYTNEVAAIDAMDRSGSSISVATYVTDGGGAGAQRSQMLTALGRRADCELKAIVWAWNNKQKHIDIRREAICSVCKR